MEITKVEFCNFMGLEQLAVKPGKVTVVSGPNHVGKSSVQIGIAEALTGGGAGKYELVRIGEDGERAKSGRVVVEVDDGALRIDRRFTASGGSVSVVQNSALGEVEAKQSQRVLDKLFPVTLSFNPVHFLLAKPAEQREMILRLIPATLTPEQVMEKFGLAMKTEGRHAVEVLEEVATALETERRDENRLVKRLIALVSEYQTKVPEEFDAEAAEAADASAFNATISNAEELQRGKNELAQQAEKDMAEAEKIDVSIVAKRIELQKLQETIVALEDQRNGLVEASKEKRRDADAIEVPDVSAVRTGLATFTETKGTLEKYNELKKTRTALILHTAVVDELNAKLTEARSMPAQILAEVELPIEGIGFLPDCVTYNNVPFHLLSKSEGTRIAVSLVREMVRKAAGEKGIKLIMVDDFEHLDAETQAAFFAEAEADDCNYIIGLVDNSATGLTISHYKGGELVVQEQPQAEPVPGEEAPAEEQGSLGL